MISHLFKLPKHRTFNYKPRHFDLDKEEREKELQRKQAEGEAKKITFEKSISIKEYYEKRKYAEQKDTRLRLYIRAFTFILLLTMVYLLYDFVGRYF